MSAHLWDEKDIAQIRKNGNSRSNSVLLAKSPVWQYRPSGNDGIKLKVQHLTNLQICRGVL